MWLTTEACSASQSGYDQLHLPFVLFGACWRPRRRQLLHQVGDRAARHLRGGPAKAAVASASTGIDLRLLDRQRGHHRHLHHPADEGVGYRADKAAAVEVASSVNGQIMPPVMGAAAF